MATGRACGKCRYFIKVNWQDKPGGLAKGRNGLCGKYDYNVMADGTFATGCIGYKTKKYSRRIKEADNV